MGVSPEGYAYGSITRRITPSRASKVNAMGVAGSISLSHDGAIRTIVYRPLTTCLTVNSVPHLNRRF